MAKNIEELQTTRWGSQIYYVIGAWCPYCNWLTEFRADVLYKEGDKIQCEKCRKFYKLGESVTGG